MSVDFPAPFSPISPTTSWRLMVIDTFFSYVAARIASLSETAEPEAVDTVPITAPENTEPEPFQ